MMTGASKRQRSRALRVILVLVAGVMFAGFFALGTWQVYRLQWKLALIERVDRRVHAAPVPAPSMAQWPQLNAEADDYRRVQLSGVLLHGATTQVLASLERGIGYWVLTPLCTADGAIVMVNRGFVPAGVGGWKPQPAPAMAPADACRAASGPALTVSGLLRLSEIAGRLRQNEPARNYWYTRDVQAIARARGLPAVAPYFVDADAASATAAGPVNGEQPVGGLTVISFVNNHLVYAITWYALALMVAGATVWVIRDARKQK
ncbi:surfeit locus 1 family protein [Duganella sp. 1224]|uniref:SURF1 family protein n=1 Tax=Duganella sp. 1224 TaxID=2587052 RepID=UPI0015C7DFCB|nr:SURF1 family protein [Duganella sp. 1224]NYE60020.1 surfeit locus 1 family protein [Duganella sp. 1224]